MDLLTILGIFNYGLVLIFGLLLSVHISGGLETPRQKKLIISLCPIFLLIQGACWLIWGVDAAKKIYPIIVHLPLVLILVFGLKKRLGIALVSVATAYLCCQLPRWVNLAVTAISGSVLAGEISYTLVILPILLLLRRYFVRVAYDAMNYSTQNLYLFGSLPFFYYIFDYATVIYSNALYSGIPALTEFFPTALIIFYVAFMSAYHAQTQNRTQAELQASMLELELKQSGTELESLRRVESQTAIYQHNMRHHLNAIDGFLSVGNNKQAQEYIRSVQADVDAITPKRFCENELVNLLCSSFASRAEHENIRLKVEARLPISLSISDTELCSILSNGLENALHAVSGLSSEDRWVTLYCGVNVNKLLVEIKNPYIGEIPMRDGLPHTTRDGHGYGCRSIRAIAQHHRGICSFEPENGVFTLRIVIPVTPS